MDVELEVNIVRIFGPRFTAYTLAGAATSGSIKHDDESYGSAKPCLRSSATPALTPLRPPYLPLLPLLPRLPRTRGQR